MCIQPEWNWKKTKKKLKTFFTYLLLLIWDVYSESLVSIYLYLLYATTCYPVKLTNRVSQFEARLRAESVGEFLIEKFLKVLGRESRSQCVKSKTKDFSSRSPSLHHPIGLHSSSAVSQRNLPTRLSRCKSMFVEHKLQTIREKEKRREEWWFVRCSPFVPHFDSYTALARTEVTVVLGCRSEEKKSKINSIHECEFELEFTPSCEGLGGMRWISILQLFHITQACRNSTEFWELED